MNGTAYNQKIEIGKWIAAFLVVTIHTSPLESINPRADFMLTQIIARIAVPFFIMVTGYFVLPQYMEGKIINGYLVRLFVLYGAATVLYMPVHLYNGYFKETDIGIRLLQDIIWNGTFYHLWYLPAMIVGMILTVMVLRILRQVCHKHQAKVAWCIVILLYGIGLFGDSYYGLIQDTKVDYVLYQPIFRIMDYTRNGLFYVPIFLLLGWHLRRANKGRAILSRRLCVIGVLVSAAAMLAEGLILHERGIQRHSSMYLCLIPCMLFLFQLLLQEKTWGEKRPHTYSFITEYDIDKFEGKKEIPMLIYILHPMSIVAVRMVVKIVKCDIVVTNSMLYFASVAVVTIGVSLLLQSVGNRWKGRKRKAGIGL